MKGLPTAPAPRRTPPPFTAEHEELRATIRRWVAAELAPHADAWERERWFPQALFPRMGELGFLGLRYPEAYGGQGGSELHDAVLAEELARCGSGGVAAGLGAHVAIATPPIFKFGTEDQKRRHLVPAIAGTTVTALAITEPDAGSDVAGIRTMATTAEGGWVLNGSKMFITNGVRADLVVLAAKTTPEGGHGGISFFLVEPAGQPGWRAEKIEKLGWHASDTALIALDDVFVPEENLLGELHGGFKLIMANFQWERVQMALGAVAAADVVLERTLAFALERRAFGRPIGTFQATRHRIADLATRVEAGRALTYHALRLHVEGRDALREVSAAKLLTQRLAFEVADACVQIHGGAGYMAEYGIERAARDARLGPIGGGTDEIMREIIGRSLGV